MIIKLSSNSIPIDGKIKLDIPANVVFGLGETLDSKDINTSAAVTVKTDCDTCSDTTNITQIILENPCAARISTTGCAQGGVFSYELNWIKNPPVQQAYGATDLITITSMTVDGFHIDQGKTQKLADLFSQLDPVKLQDIQIIPTNPDTGAIGSYEIMMTANTMVPKDSYVIVTFPPELTSTLASTGTTPTLCAQLFDPSITLNGGTASTVTCEYLDAPTNKQIKVMGLFPANTSGIIGMTFNGIQNPATAGKTDTFTFEIKNAAN